MDLISNDHPASGYQLRDSAYLRLFLCFLQDLTYTPCYSFSSAILNEAPPEGRRSIRWEYLNYQAAAACFPLAAFEGNHRIQST